MTMKPNSRTTSESLASNCRDTVVFARRNWVGWCLASIGSGSGGIYCPVIGTFRFFWRPRPRDGLPVERVSNEDHCHDEHEDGEDDHNALKIESTQK